MLLGKEYGGGVKVIGHPTIGWGFNLDVGLTRIECDSILRDRVNDLNTTLTRAWPWFGRLDIVRTTVILSLAYNLGLHGLRKFKKMIRACEDGAWGWAEVQLLDSLAARQLPRRYKRLGKALRTGRW